MSGSIRKQQSWSRVQSGGLQNGREAWRVVTDREMSDERGFNALLFVSVPLSSYGLV